MYRSRITVPSLSVVVTSPRGSGSAKPLFFGAMAGAIGSGAGADTGKALAGRALARAVRRRDRAELFIGKGVDSGLSWSLFRAALPYEGRIYTPRNHIWLGANVFVGQIQNRVKHLVHCALRVFLMENVIHDKGICRWFVACRRSKKPAPFRSGSGAWNRPSNHSPTVILTTLCGTSSASCIACESLASSAAFRARRLASTFMRWNRSGRALASTLGSVVK